MWIARDNQGRLSFHTIKPRHTTYFEDKFFFDEGGEAVLADGNLLKFIKFCGFDINTITYNNSPVEIKIERVKCQKKN